MDKSYYVRGQKVTVDEMDFVAVRVGKSNVEEGASNTILEALHAEAADGSGKLDEEIRAFEKAGWRFDSASGTAGDSEATSPVRGRVFRDRKDHILVGTGHLNVRFDPTLDSKQCRGVLDDAGLDVVRRLEFAPNLYEVKARQGVDFMEAAVRLHKRRDVIYAEPQLVERITQRFAPSDPRYREQWHLKNTGQNEGSRGADIDAEGAWDRTRGAGVRIAVVDNGFDIDHHDLAGAVTLSSGFFDQDGHFVRDLDNYPDDNHGTLCAGMAVARADNGRGGCGVAHQSEFMAVACLPDQIGSKATLARALAYAADPRKEVPGADPAEGADVISCSLGSGGLNGVLQDAIDFAVTRGRGGLGTTIFWAVTNEETAIRKDEVCAYHRILAVGRSDRNDKRGEGGFGPELEFLATGVDVRSTTSGGTFGVANGASFATPTAAGVAALMLSVHPGLRWEQVRQIMGDTCDRIGGQNVIYDGNGHNTRYGFGRVNAARAVASAERMRESLMHSRVVRDKPDAR